EELVGPILGLAQAAERLDYRGAFLRHAALDPHRATAADFLACAREHNISLPPGMESESRAPVWCDLLLTHLVEPQLGLGRMTFLYDYPADQAALARLRAGDPPLAERFELYVEGIELANGFHELGDRAEQAARFARQNETRAAQALPTVPLDEHLLAALGSGLPGCAGVALGIDRLLMLKTGSRRIEDVLAFPLERA
ncbi:MAG: EF-P lysine aminoacylase GenX, partial [Gammaproteobacteria bacterium]|nr:EF-P lysine aminoacylase GenX [Gammaproteobacteria bacterium]